jgi:coenzyme F420-0:L-glutamate ligase / coenzyme F420-1:gamma-L-glutamate ligase
MSLIITPLTGIPIIAVGDDLVDIIDNALRKDQISLANGDIIVIAQKIISKSEGRFVKLAEIEPSLKARELALSTEKDPRLVELILQESKEIIRTKHGAIIVEHRMGFVCANAGIDHSNVIAESDESEETVLLLPLNPDLSAQILREKLENLYRVRIGVMIIDSHGRAWRLGTVGTAIGISGLPGLVDLRGKPDMFGNKLKITEVGAADELAAAASLVMGQASEGTPIVHVGGFPYELKESSLSELLRPKEQDLFR